MDQFLETILMSSAFRAATGQGKDTHVYRSRKSGETNKNYGRQKLLFRTAFRKRVIQECRIYRADQTDQARWLELIEQVRTDLSLHFSGILHDGKLRVGTVQKMLSLALKLYWKSGANEKKPFWPPLDAQVIKAAKKGLEKRDQGISWKRLDNTEQYARMMRAIDVFAKNRGFADACDWEYEEWQTNDEL